MNFLEELKNIKYKELSPQEDIEFNNDVGKIESSIKTEIKKSNLILQKKFDNLEKEINNLNLENDTLKKELFKSEREKKDIRENLFEILDIYFPLNDLVKDNEIKVTIDLMKKKVSNTLRKMKIEETAIVGEPFNYIYHETLNSSLDKNKIYVIKSIVSQGYIKEGKILKVAKVIVEEK